MSLMHNLILLSIGQHYNMTLLSISQPSPFYQSQRPLRLQLVPHVLYLNVCGEINGVYVCLDESIDVYESQ